MWISLAVMEKRPKRLSEQFRALLLCTDLDFTFVPISPNQSMHWYFVWNFSNEREDWEESQAES